MQVCGGPLLVNSAQRDQACSFSQCEACGYTGFRKQKALADTVFALARETPSQAFGHFKIGEN